MAWATPITHSVGDILTASDWNITSNDVTFLASTSFASVGASQSTASGSYTDLATVGPAVTVTTGTSALVILTCNGANSGGGFDAALMGFAVSGATTVAASDAQALLQGEGTANTSIQASAVIPISGLNAGSNTFTAKYKAGSGGTATFSTRYIAVIPLP